MGRWVGARHGPRAEGCSILWQGSGGAEAGPTTGWPHSHLLAAPDLPSATLGDGFNLSALNIQSGRRPRPWVPHTPAQAMQLCGCLPAVVMLATQQAKIAVNHLWLLAITCGHTQARAGDGCGWGRGRGVVIPRVWDDW